MDVLIRFFLRFAEREGYFPVFSLFLAYSYRESTLYDI